MSLGPLPRLLSRRDRLTLAAIGLLTLISSGLELLSVGLVYPLLRLIAQPADTSWLPKWLPMAGVPPTSLLLAAATIFLAAAITKSLFNLLTLRFQEAWYQQLSERLSSQLLARYMAAPWEMHLQRNSAELVAVADGAATWPLVTSLRSWVIVISEGIVLVGVLGILGWVATAPLLLSAAAIGLIFVAVSRRTSRRLDTLGRLGTTVVGERGRLIRQALSSLRELRILGRPQWFELQYNQARHRDGQIQQELNTLFATPRLLLEPLVVAAWVAVVVSIVVFHPGDLPRASAILGVFALGGLRLMPSLTRILGAAASIRAYGASIELIRVDLMPTAGEPVLSVGCAVPKLAREIRFDAVGYRYPVSARHAVTDLSITLEMGKSIGIVGQSGAGKTTFVDLLLGLIEPTVGRITVDGIDIAGDLRCWQSQIGYVPQRVATIDASLAENVAFGIPTDEIDHARLAEALAAAELTAWIEDAASGVTTTIGEEGAQLSGGERQRVGIARALYDKRRVLVLDEATSALDGRTGARISETLKTLRDTHTIIIVAHNISTVADCDLIVFMKAGQIEEFGKFDVLLQRNREFAQLVMAEKSRGD